MKKRIPIILLLLSLILVSLTHCIGDRAVKELIINDGLKLEYELGEMPDFSAVTATVVYNDDTTEVVGYEELVFGELDTSIPGTKTLTISYDDFVAYKTVTVNGAGYDPSQLSIVKVSLPSSLADFEASKSGFTNKSHGYVVGDDNSFYLTLKILAISSDKIPQVVSSYVSESQVYLEGSAKPLEGDELELFVSIDEEKNAFDFTEVAIGKTFTISTRPRDIAEDKISAFTKSFTVTVVDGYNIYQAYELNYITNTNDSGPFPFIDSEETRNQSQIVDDFLLNEKNSTRPDALTAIVIHNHLTIEPTDIPKEYFLDKSRDKGLIDDLSIFYHVNTEASPHFKIHGNYFSIYTYNLPTVIAEGGNQKDGISNSSLLYFGPNVEMNINYDHTKLSTTISNLHIADDTSTSSDEEKTAESMLGLIAMQTSAHLVNINNVKLEAFLASLVAEKDYHTVNIIECKFTNAWHNHITLNSRNPAQEPDEEPLDKSKYPRLTLNIHNSVISKSGGPAIICQTNNPEYTRSKHSGPDIYISEDSTVESWVTGSEAWFTSIDVGIKMDTVLQSLLYPLDESLRAQDSSFITEKTITGETTPRRYFNLVMVNLYIPDTSNGFNDLFQQLSGKTDIDGRLTVGNKTILDMDDGIYDGKTYNYKNKTLSEVKENATASNMVLNTPSGGVGHTTFSNQLITDAGSLAADETNNYLNVLYLSLNIVFGNYHSIK